MNEHELLVRIDERVALLIKAQDVTDLELDDLKTWKNRTAGALSILFGIMGYTYMVEF